MYGPISTKEGEYVTRLTGMCLSVNIPGLDNSLAQYIGAPAPWVQVPFETIHNCLHTCSEQ